MRTVELARKIADYYGLPVKIITAKRNPLEYRQRDNNLILRDDSIRKLPGKGKISQARKLISQDWVLRETRQATFEGIPVSKVEPEKQEAKPESELPDTMLVELKKLRKPPRVKIGGPNDVAQFMRHVADYDRENAKILHLDTKNQVVGVENISTGSLNASIVHPREAVKGAILNNSNAVIFVHNHPSGNPEPSVEDMNIHKQLKEAFGTVGIDLLDSMIIGKDGHVSLRERGL